MILSFKSLSGQALNPKNVIFFWQRSADYDKNSKSVAKPL